MAKCIGNLRIEGQQGVIRIDQQTDDDRRFVVVEPELVDRLVEVLLEAQRAMIETGQYEASS
jgi:hypothetical protein